MPYYISYERLSQEAGALNGNPFNLTSEMRNQILAVPPFMTYLYAGLKNKTPKEMAGDEKLVSLIEYTLKYHMGAESGQANMATIHGALKVQYDIGFTAQYMVNQLEGDLLVVPVTILAVHMLNACILYASHNEDGQPVEDTMAKINEVAALFNRAFQAMESSIGAPITDSIVFHLSTVHQLI